jgi:phage terminase large subunit-like protein
MSLEALDVLSALVLEDGRRWGEAAAPFQWQDARAVLQPEGAPYHFLTRSRGSSKTSDLAGIAIAASLTQLPAASHSYALAADRDQGRLLVDAVEGFVRRTPMLRDSFQLGTWRVVNLRNGAVLEVLAADAAGAWGLRPAFVIVDEIAQWASTSAPRRLWEAVSTAVAKVEGARLAVLTTAGDPAHWSRKLLDHAQRDPLWRVHEVRGPAPWLEPSKLDEQRRRLPESSYRRLFLNEWVASEDRLTTAEDLAACVTHDGPLAPIEGTRYVVGLDLGIKHDRTAAAICHAERSIEGRVRVVLDRLQVWSGTRKSPVRLSEVGEWLLFECRSYNGASIVFDPHQAIDLTQRLTDRGIRTHEFTFSSASVGRLASTLHLLLRDHALSLPDDELLLEELATVRLRETSPGVLRMDHDADKHDDRAIALALAAQRLVELSAHLNPSPSKAFAEINASFVRASPWIVA